MRKTFKNYLAQELNADVEAKRISYNKNNITRNYIIAALDGDLYEDEVDNVIPEEVHEYYIDRLDEHTLKFQIVLPLGTEWNAWENEILDFWNPEEEEDDESDDCFEQKEDEVPVNIEEMIDNLKVGPCYIPGIGAGFSSNEEDLEKLKQFLRGAMTMAKMMGMN